jgi:ABC-type Fe3+-siderophore transport system permease subunit
MNRERGCRIITCLLAFGGACVGFLLPYSFASGEDKLADTELHIIFSIATGVFCYALIWSAMTFIV